ncbi:gliding motility-associated C-terminal domain-containing protein [uncultured Hymenobacter sp.]|uniref:T9SS type B sorting domain-containing protein n=1 Tax=uncultured Hymenobacter sp. TaxID=170016 RepID=UPI0035CC6369
MPFLPFLFVRLNLKKRLTRQLAGLLTGLLGLLGLLAAGPAAATHIVGGELDLQYVQNNDYRLSLNLYFDAVNGQPGALDNALTASIFEKGTNRWLRDVVLPLSSNTFVNYTNPACTVGTLITRKLLYSLTLALPADTYQSAAGYYVAVERCCRNNGIANIVRPGDAAQTFYLEFPAVVRQGRVFRDSTPRTFPPLGDYACLGELFYYDFGGQDADGDSLVYDMVTPLNGYSTPGVPKPGRARPAPYPLVQWQPQPAGRPALGPDNQIPGRPALGINARTGRLTVQPTQEGLFVFGVRCQEFRRGEKIGETRRDFQLYVLKCPRNAAPSLVLVPETPGARPYRPGRDTLRVTATGNRCLRLRFTDADPNSRLTATVRPVNFGGLLPTFSTSTTGTVRAAGRPDTLTATLCFPPCLDTKGQVYLLDVMVADDGCSLPKRDTLRVAFTAQPAPDRPPTASSTAGPSLPLRVRVGDVVRFNVLAADPDADPLTLQMSGTGFAPTDLGAALSQTTAGNQIQGQFEWKVDCRAAPPAGAAPVAREFVFTARSQPCAEPQTALVRVPIIVDYSNQAPELTSTLPPAAAPALPPLVRLSVGETYTATLDGTDADRDALVLSAAGEGFDLAAAGMRFTAQDGAGQARATFRWDATCAAVGLPKELLVTFQLAESTCRPEPQSRSVRFALINPDTLAFDSPNIITPNGDGLNDFFTFEPSQSENAKNPVLPADFCNARFADVKIFSRWGQLLYQTDNRQFRWGGQGLAATYLYLITFTDGRRFKGWLSVQP